MASKLPETFALAPLATVKVSSSNMTPTSFCAVGVSLTPVTVIVRVAVSVASPSSIV